MAHSMTKGRAPRPALTSFLLWPLRELRRRHPLLRRLLERVGERNQLRLAARHPGEADTGRRRLGVESRRERLRLPVPIEPASRAGRIVRDEAEGDDHRRITGL